MTENYTLSVKEGYGEKNDQRRVKEKLRRKLYLRIKEALKEVTMKNYTFGLKEIILRKLAMFKKCKNSKVQKIRKCKKI